MGKLARWLTSYVHPWHDIESPRKKLPTQLPLSFMAFRFFSFFDFASPSFSLPSRETVLWILIFSLRRDVSAFIVITEYAGNLPLDQCPVVRGNAVTFYIMRNWFLESRIKFLIFIIVDIYAFIGNSKALEFPELDMIRRNIRGLQVKILINHVSCFFPPFILFFFYIERRR